MLAELWTCTNAFSSTLQKLIYATLIIYINFKLLNKLLPSLPAALLDKFVHILTHYGVVDWTTEDEAAQAKLPVQTPVQHAQMRHGFKNLGL